MKMSHLISTTMLATLCVASLAIAQTTRPSTPPAAVAPQNQFQDQQQQRFNNFRNNNNNNWQGGGGGFNRRDRRQWSQGSAADGMFSAATTQPDVTPTPTPKDMVGSYLVLTVRSIFFKGYFIPPGEQQRDTQPFRQPGLVLIFNGAARTDNGDPKAPNALEAFLEDNETGKITSVHVGDAVAQGKVAHISLDTLDYQPTGGSIIHIGIGQNLLGEQVWGAGSTATASSTTSPSPDISGPSGDVLKKMMLRRQQELAGSK